MPSSIRIIIISIFMIFECRTVKSINRLKRDWPNTFPFPSGQSFYPAQPSFPGIPSFQEMPSFPISNYGLSSYNPQNLQSLSNIPTSSNNQFQKISVPAGSTIYIFGGGETKYSAPENPSLMAGLLPFGSREPSLPNNFPNNNNQFNNNLFNTNNPLNNNPFASAISQNNIPALYQNLQPYPLPPPPFPPNVLNNWISNPSVTKPPPQIQTISKSPWAAMQEIFTPLLSTLGKGPNTLPMLTIPTTKAPDRAQIQQTGPIRSPPNNLTICEKDTKSLNCADNKIIKVIAATFGRQMWYICDPSMNTRLTTQCVSGNTLENVLGRCDGKPQCSLTADTQLGGGGDPCPGVPKYLTVLYDCI